MYYRIFAIEIMVNVKSDNYSLQDQNIAQFAKALGHPARIAILRFLAKKKSCICGSIVEQLPLSQSTVSQHLKELKKAGIIKGKISGNTVCYCINEKVWMKLIKTMNVILSIHNIDNPCCK